MIVKTRYRDIDKPEHAIHSVWEPQRGEEILIEVPAGVPRFAHGNIGNCAGPWFRVVGKKHPRFGNTLWVCPHIAEIGD